MIRSRKPLLANCERALLEELSNISIERMGNVISVYNVIEAILQDPKVESVFCEGSFVMYAFNKLCKNHSENRLIKPGDIDLHIDYHGSWYDFTGARDHRETQSHIADLSSRKKSIMSERRDMDFQESQLHRRDELNEIANDIRRLTTQNIQDINTPITQLLDLKSQDLEVKPFNIAPQQTVKAMTEVESQEIRKIPLRKLLDLYNPSLHVKPVDTGSHRTINVATTVEFPLLHTGTFQWKRGPSLELTITNIDAKAEYQDDMKPGYVVENIPKFFFTLEGGRLHITGENLYDNYTDISLSASERGATSCASLIKAYEIYLRYMAIPEGKTYREHVPIDPIRSALMFHKLKCIKDIPSDIDAWEKGANDESELNEFICGILKKIGNKHYSSHETIQKMLILLKESLQQLAERNFNYKEGDLEGKLNRYLIACMVQCLTTGIYGRFNELEGNILKRLNEVKLGVSGRLTPSDAKDIHDSYEKYNRELMTIPNSITNFILATFGITSVPELTTIDNDVMRKIRELHDATKRNAQESVKRHTFTHDRPGAGGWKRTKRKHRAKHSSKKHTKRKHKPKKSKKNKKNKTKHRHRHH